MLHVKEEAKNEVKPHEFWIAIAFMVLLLGVLGFYSFQNKPLPEIPGWLLAIPLGLVWASAIINLVRNRRVFLAPMYLMYLVGYSLFVTAKLAPQWWRGIADPEIIWWIGTILLMVPALSSFIGFGKRQPVPEVTEPEPERIAAR